MEMHIRRYEPCDRQRILEITAEVFEPVSLFAAIQRKFGVLNNTTWQERKMAEVAGELEDNPGGTFVAEVSGEVVGYITTELDQDSATGRVRNLAVAAQYQGRGVGKALLNTALDYFEAVGMMYSQIETLTCNQRADRFYRQVGYREVGRKIYYCMCITDRRRI